MNSTDSVNASRANGMRHRQSAATHDQRRVSGQSNRVSNLTMIMMQHESQPESQHDQEDRAINAALPTHSHQVVASQSTSSEADSACEIPLSRPVFLGSSAPGNTSRSRSPSNFVRITNQHRSISIGPGGKEWASERVRRCLSSKELGTLAPPSGSAYENMLIQKLNLEESLKRRLQKMKATSRRVLPDQSDDSTSTSSRRKESGNENRNRKRSLHNKAIADDLCEVVADLFLSESKLLQPTQYGVPEDPSVHGQRDEIVAAIHKFVNFLPTRYSVGIETPSEVLLHMRLMAAVRADATKAAVHIHNLEDDECTTRGRKEMKNRMARKMLRLVTISCRDCQGLLEVITKALASGGSRVLDADVITSNDGVILDRFIVEMSGRLRLDKLSQLIEAFLVRESESEASGSNGSDEKSDGSAKSKAPEGGPSGPLYYREEGPRQEPTPMDLAQEMEGAVPLAEMLESSPSLAVPRLRKLHSMPNQSASFQLKMRPDQDRNILDDSRNEAYPQGKEDRSNDSRTDSLSDVRPPNRRRPLVNRKARPDLGVLESESRLELRPLDYVTVPDNVDGHENRAIPLIPFDELMLIETIGVGSSSTIYRAAWQGAPREGQLSGVQMVALKVAMINSQNGDTSHVDELRREADIAARLEHPNICKLVGVAADTDCFCLAYNFCEGGSLLSLLSDSKRYYEYLPIALDIANGMAYLHSRNIIHRDLKPSNVLLSSDHRARISDFGMSVAFAGQELTAETGTYRYMAPEVIRHESYSSNADVYSFGICLWQLITRELPFATLTPIQAAFAVAEGRRPAIPPSTPRRLQEIIEACWDQDSYRRPSFTYVAMALADYAKMAFSPANVGALTLQIANEMLATVDGSSNVNVDFTAPLIDSYNRSDSPGASTDYMGSYLRRSDSIDSDVGLTIDN